jgi:uncharacterized protein (PEP-CTERM system associated)
VRPRAKYWLGTLALLALVATASPVVAAGLRVEPRITVSTSFTDNIDLDDSVKGSGLALLVSPGISLHKETRLTSLNLSYTGNFFYFTNRKSEEWRNNLQGSLKTQLIEKFLHVDLRALISQPIVDQRREYSFSQFNSTRNRRQAQSYSASPYLTLRAGAIADIEVRYAYRFVTVSDPKTITEDSLLIDDYHSHTGSLSIVSGPAFKRLSWQVDGHYERSFREGFGSDSQDTSIRGRLEYRVQHWLGILGSVGWDEYDDIDISTHRGGTSWDVGVRLNPNRRIDVAVRYGRRYGDNDFDVEASYEHRRLKLKASYSRDVTQSQRLYAESIEEANVSNDLFTNSFGTVIDSNEELFVDSRENVVGFSNETFYRKRFQLDVEWEKRHTIVHLGFFTEDRRFDVRDYRIDEIGGVFSLRHNLNPRNYVTAYGQYRHSKFADGFGRVDDLYAVRINYTRQFSRTLEASIGYIFSTRSSNRLGSDSSENVVTLSLRSNY